jgi:hypothetical protein
LFPQPNESKRAKKILELAIHNRMRAKELKRCLSSLILSLSALDESKKADKPTLPLSRSCSTCVRVMILALSQVFSNSDVRTQLI